MSVTWGPDGIDVEGPEAMASRLPAMRRDNLARRHIDQAELRARVYEATHPRVTIARLARLAGVDPRTISAFATGGRTPQPAVLAAIAAALESTEEVSA